MIFSSEIETVNAFCEDAMLNSHRSAWKKRRKENCIYANILITNGGFTILNGTMWCWWRDYVGLEIFARIRLETCRHTGKTILSEAFPVRLTNTLITEGRGITPDCFSLV